MLKKLFSALVLVSAGSLAAFVHPSAGEWGVFGEYLYQRPTVDDTYFVISAPATATFPNGSRINNDFNYRSGYRVGGSYGFCNSDSDFSISYTHLKTSKTKVVTGDFLWATNGRADLASGFEDYAGTATSSLGYHYQRYDGLFSQSIYNSCGSSVRFQFGVEYAQLRFNEDYTYTVTGAAAGTISQRSKTWGVGPEIGLEINYSLWDNQCCNTMPGTLYINVLSSGSILAAETKTSEDNAIDGVSLLDVSGQRAHRIIPAVHARIGLAYETAFCGNKAAIEVGYEFNSYYRGLARVTYPDDVADSLSYNNYYNFDSQGLYVTASVAF